MPIHCENGSAERSAKKKSLTGNDNMEVQVTNLQAIVISRGGLIFHDISWKVAWKIGQTKMFQRYLQFLLVLDMASLSDPPGHPWRSLPWDGLLVRSWEWPSIIGIHWNVIVEGLMVPPWSLEGLELGDGDVVQNTMICLEAVAQFVFKCPDWSFEEGHMKQAWNRKCMANQEATMNVFATSLSSWLSSPTWVNTSWLISDFQHDFTVGWPENSSTLLC